MASATPSPAAITIDELIVLNDEIAALTRAGVPIESGLEALGSDMPGRLGQFARDLAKRSGRGESLADVVREYSSKLPPVYLAVIEVGLRAGRLPAALETLATAIHRVTDTRRAVVSAFLYPLLLVALAWLFFAFFASRLAGDLSAGFTGMEVPGGGFYSFLASLGETAPYWAPVLPALLIVFAIWWWRSATRATIAEPTAAWRLFGWLPWLGTLFQYSRVATFTEILALLLESRVPLDEAIVLAAEACGDRQMVAASQRMSEELRQGTPVRETFESFPPLLSWMLASAGRRTALLPALRHAGETYRRRTRHQAEMARTFLPVLAVMIGGGGILLLYTLILFAPYASMLRHLAVPT